MNRRVSRRLRRNMSTVQWAQPTYSGKILSYGPIAYWPLDETSGTNADNAEGTAARDGTYDGVTLADDVFTDGAAAALWDGTDDTCDVYSTSLNGVFDGSMGTMAGWARASSAGVWSDATFRTIHRIRTTSGSQVSLFKTDTANQLQFNYNAGGTNKTRTAAVGPTTDWFHWAMSWSDASQDDELKVYIDAVQVGATITANGTWSGDLQSTTCRIGSNDATTVLWSGHIHKVALFDTVLNAAAIADLADPTP